jgi:tripartite-type tricarboxylate transporter receptor subunit TctC
LTTGRRRRHAGRGHCGRAAPDGYTLFMGAVHHTIAPSMYPKLDYDIEKDLIPLILVASVPQVVVVNPKNVPVANFKAAFWRWCARTRASSTTARPAPAPRTTWRASCSSSKARPSSPTSPTAAPARRCKDLIAGNVDMMFDGLGSSAAHIKGGRIKALMVSGTKRSPAFPDVPCAAEVGLPDYNVTTWYGLWAPKGTPADVQARAIDEIRKACSTDEAKAVWAAQGADFRGPGGAQFGGFISAEVKKWAQVVKASGATLDSRLTDVCCAA